MSFLNNPKLALTDLTKSDKLNENLKRIERDEKTILKRISRYDSEIEDIHKKISKKGKELKRAIDQMYRHRKDEKKFTEFSLEKKRINKEQNALIFREEAKIRNKQAELIQYYRDLRAAARLLEERKKLVSSQAKKVNRTILAINKHMK